MKDIVIFGVGGFAEEILFLIESVNEIRKSWNFCGFVVENKDGDFSRKEIFGTEDELEMYKREMFAAIGIGTPNIIEKIFTRFNHQINFPNIIYPGIVWKKRTVQMGSGNLICAGNAFTCNITIGNANIFNLSSTFGHECKIGNYNVFNPGVNCSGGVAIGDSNLIGTGSTLLQYTELGNGNTLGAQALLSKKYADNNILVGVPAKQKQG